MKPLVTKAQGRAALERADEISGGRVVIFDRLNSAALYKIGWRHQFGFPNSPQHKQFTGTKAFIRSHALTALAWIATIGGALDEE